MPKISILSAIKRLKRPVFTTREAAACAGGSLSNTVQALNNLVKQGVVVKIARGVWGLDMGGHRLSRHSVIPFLLPRSRAYVSFLSALHLHGIIEQIPQSVMLASVGHTKTVKTKFGTFFFHKISPGFFKGFGWHKSGGEFLIAEPEKALIDCLYLSARKKRQFGHFPELRFPKSFSFKKARRWAGEIPDKRLRTAVLRKLGTIYERV
ncbi:MAG: type IV toxin-antitoxin system AbiEi family antitoxin domain-containing protein [Acidobacteria bacterium]|nr:type IV toxin-antitoxin system AbiEi family antitoxin domain-containing protein [Acidobacteriota bacterium]MBI3658476.1 type IV toxin-antitoxin system AbiEi family antitoxin domain-containing protein [Acidobacteriota bacterium]